MSRSKFRLTCISLLILLTAAGPTARAGEHHLEQREIVLGTPGLGLEAKVSADGLKLGEPEGSGGIRVHAAELGRVGSPEVIGLDAVGSVRTADSVVVFARPWVSEEFRSTEHGLRQDFIVHHAPPGLGTCRLRLAVVGARPEAMRAGARLWPDSGGKPLIYHRLHVTDRVGRKLPASMHVAGDSIQLDFDAADDDFPVRVDPTFTDEDWITLNPEIAGLNGEVLAMTSDGMGNVYVGGNFTVAGGILANNVAMWDGSDWHALGQGVAGGGYTVEALVWSGGKLYAGGSFSESGGVPLSNVGVWDGQSWSSPGPGLNGTVEALAVFEGQIVAGGSFTKAGAVTVNRVARWNGVGWSGSTSAVFSPA